jgi:MSHA biogenesis protein MshN
MSLINQMLQELDARRAEAAAGNGSFGQQVRAVPERGRLHPIWWVGIGVALVVAAGGSGAWYWMRSLSRAPAAPVVPAPNLPLKIDIGLSEVSRAIPQSAESAQIGSEPARASVAAISQQDNPTDRTKPGMPAAPAQTAHGQHQANAVPGAAPGSNEPQAGLPDIAKVVPHAKSMAIQPADKAAEQPPSPVLTKQFKELTPQQLAENEYRKGVASLQQGKGSEAIASLEQALQFDPAHAAARQTLIGILLDNKHRDGAIRRAREGLDVDSAQPGLAMILARLQVEKGELQPAIETLERTLPYAVDRAEYQAFLAALLQRAERHKEAVEHYFVALQKAPQNGVWWMGAAISLQADRRKQEAIEAFKRAKATNSLSPALQEFVDTQIAQLQQR